MATAFFGHRNARTITRTRSSLRADRRRPGAGDPTNTETEPSPITQTPRDGLPATGTCLTNVIGLHRARLRLMILLKPLKREPETVRHQTKVRDIQRRRALAQHHAKILLLRTAGDGTTRT